MNKERNFIVYHAKNPIKINVAKFDINQHIRFLLFQELELQFPMFFCIL